MFAYEQLTEDGEFVKMSSATGPSVMSQRVFDNPLTSELVVPTGENLWNAQERIINAAFLPGRCKQRAKHMVFQRCAQLFDGWDFVMVQGCLAGVWG